MNTSTNIMKRTLSVILIYSFLAICIHGQVALHLTANYTRTDTIRPGDPIVLQLRLFNAHAEYAEMHNAAVRENLAVLREEYDAGSWTKEEYENEKNILENSIKNSSAVSISGEVVSSAISLFFDGQQLPASAYIYCGNEITSDQQFTLSSSERYGIRFGISPQATARWTPGDYILKVQIDTFATDSVRIRIQQDYSNTKSEEATLFELGYFYLDCGDPNDVLDVADIILQQTPESIEALTLKGDAFSTKEENTRALQWYREALKMFFRQFPDSYEAPDYLLDRIDDLEMAK